MIIDPRDPWVVPFSDKTEYLYRFIGNAEEAKDFSEGTIHLSTLAHIRGIESETFRRAGPDPDEGKSFYNTGVIVGDGDDPAVQEMGRQGGPKLAPNFKRYYGSENTVEEFLPDLWMLCMTIDPDGHCKAHFGPHGFRIFRPMKFFEIISQRMIFDYGVGAPRLGGINYRRRDRTGSEPRPNAREIPFIKPKWPFRQENEVRGVWSPDLVRDDLPRVTLKIPGLAEKFIQPLF